MSGGELVLQAIEGGHTGLVARTRQRPQRSEQRLIAAAREGSAEAFEALYRQHWPKAYRTAFLIVHDESAAEDIAQEAFLGAIRALDRFDRRCPFGPWLHRIVANRAIDWTRARALRREVGDERLGMLAAPTERGAELGGDLMAVIATLPLEQRAALVLRYVLEYTPGEISEMLDLPRGTVNSRMRRALDTLERQIA